MQTKIEETSSDIKMKTGDKSNRREKRENEIEEDVETLIMRKEGRTFSRNFGYETKRMKKRKL